MIPKIIHYCWFGRNPKPKLAEKCMGSWKKYCKDYQIIEWNEDSFDISKAPLYVQQAYDEKKWAYVSDYVRLYAVYMCGGVYLDTDVEIVNSLDNLLKNYAFFGFENNKHIATGLGFGAEKGARILQEIMSQYDCISFIMEDGSYDFTPCPQRNTEVFLKYGLKQNGETQMLKDDVLILSSEFLCPIDYETKKMKKTDNTISIHWFESSWMSEEGKKIHKNQIRQIKKTNTIHWILHIPNLIILRVLGEERYDKIKHKLKT